jgi:hypothetical protein
MDYFQLSLLRIIITNGIVGLVLGGGVESEGEDIQLIELTPTEALEKIKNQEISDAKQLCPSPNQAKISSLYEYVKKRFGQFNFA